MGSQVLPETCSSVGFPGGHRILQTSTCSSMGVLQWASMGCRGQLPPHGLHRGCRGISDPAPGAPPTAPSSLTLMSAQLFFSLILTLSSDSSCCCTVTFHPLLQHIISFSDRVLALTTNRPVLGLPAASHTRHLCNPPATKTLQHLPNTDSFLKNTVMW